MTPAKKAAPSKSLADLLEDKPPVVDSETPPEVENPPEVDDDGDLEDAEAQDENPEDDVTLIPANENPVHTWEENHDHNLAKLHPDVIVSGKPENANTVTSTVTETVYANESEDDDKGRYNASHDEENE